MTQKKKIFKRPEWDEHWLEIAGVISKRSTCLRRRFGAIIVRENTILTTGFNGAPRSTPNCIDLGVCYREDHNIKHGTQYEKCRAIHAEANAIINAAREGIVIKETVLYLHGEDFDHTPVKDIIPCKMCRRMIINVGINKVIVMEKNKIKAFDVMRWIIDANEDPFKELEQEEY